MKIIEKTHLIAFDRRDREWSQICRVGSKSGDTDRIGKEALFHWWILLFKKVSHTNSYHRLPGSFLQFLSVAMGMSIHRWYRCPILMDDDGLLLILFCPGFPSTSDLTEIQFDNWTNSCHSMGSLPPQNFCLDVTMWWCWRFGDLHWIAPHRLLNKNLFVFIWMQCFEFIIQCCLLACDTRTREIQVFLFKMLGQADGPIVETFGCKNLCCLLFFQAANR